MNASTIPCRVCRQPAQHFFEKRVLGRHEVEYFKCDSCGHVQTEEPYWLDEAYRNLSFQRDTGMADRCIWTAQTTVALAHRLMISPEAPCLDWGGGTGLFVRICRDYGMNFFYQDRYAKNIFACGFEFSAVPASPHVTLLTAFEVAEHLPDPMTAFAELLRLEPQYLLISTLLYLGQGKDWWYFLDDGQHVAFYTRRSLEAIAKQHGYHLLSNDCDLHMFSKRAFRNGLLDACRKSRERLAARYRKQHGSRILSDFQQMSKIAGLHGRHASAHMQEGKGD